MMVENWRMRSRSNGSRAVDRLGRRGPGIAMPYQTVPTGWPSISSGPATPVTEMPTSAPSTRCAPSAICFAASSVTTCSAVTPSTSRFTSVAYDAIEPRNVAARAGHVGEARADEPAGERLGDAERPARAPRRAAAPPTPSSRRRPRTRARRAPCAARASSGVEQRARLGFGRRLRRHAHVDALDAAGEERDRGVGLLVDPVGDHLGQPRLRRAPRLQRARHDHRSLARALEQVGQHVLA